MKRRKTGKFENKHFGELFLGLNTYLFLCKTNSRWLQLKPTKRRRDDIVVVLLLFSIIFGPQVNAFSM